ncbi:MAG TPA: DUF4410 domain-containing protein [Candidatus Limnocylindria bacterium]|nr:DUF4410 domain-containing protein [Candidatus Limnocylindria bacterium]
MKKAGHFCVSAFLVAASLFAGTARSADEKKPQKISASSIQVLLIQSDEVKLPAEFQMALYEHLIGELQKTGKFEHVYRDGDHAAADAKDMISIRSNVTGFKQGSERARQVTTVAGATSITIHCQFVDKSGKVQLEREITGKVRFFGGNLRATYDFAKKVAKEVQESF